MENGTIDRSLAKEYLPQMHYRVCGMKRDYETFLRVISELQVDQKRMPDVKRHQINITNQIRVSEKKISKKPSNIVNKRFKINYIRVL
jgi:hypothetical protein